MLQTVVVFVLSTVPAAAQTAGGWVCFGAKCAGSEGIAPNLGISGSPTPGLEFSVVVSDARTGSPGVLLFGLDTGSTPILGCTLNIGELLPLSVPFVTSATPNERGTWTLPIETPEQMPALTLQAFVADEDGPFGVSGTNGVGLIPGSPIESPGGGGGDFPVDPLQPHR